MLKRAIKERFPVNMRYAEDYWLWLMILNRYKVGLFLESDLASVHKPFYGASGLSSNLCAMEMGVQKCFKDLLIRNKVKLHMYFITSLFSWCKFIRRFVISKLKNR
jgi:hypothetical protein